MRSPEALKALQSLRRIKQSIDSNKDSEHAAHAVRLLSKLTALRDCGRSRFDEVAERLRPLLDGVPPRRRARKPRLRRPD